ncbi:MAG: KUP/HAK/KT family potassium transporter [Bacteroidetes bacterium]|nr:KUP/HAK/KT family potassium transporter [Bacteroidota bacterium]
MSNTRHSHIPAVSGAALLVTLGIIFGDIGTSPLYVIKAIIGSTVINRDLVLGGISCIFWTLTLLSTIKYVILVLRADNRGEGGIFALYTLVKKTKIYWLIIPAMIGGSALIADGILTPAISVSSAVEGLRNINGNIETLPIVIIILTALFAIQQFGTGFVGKFFGPVMLVWFAMLGILGFMAISAQPEILNAINPYYAYHLLVVYPKGFWILGAVFLCTTGAEGMYSDMGHCGKTNIRITWTMVKVMLLLNYFGQGAWLLQHPGITLKDLGDANPFYSIMPTWFLFPGIIISTVATIVASQALITGSFTIINEAIRLNFWPKVRIVHPTNYSGQMYIPSVNWLLFISCIGVVFYFKESTNMEAAYGLTINLNMLMTTILLAFYMRVKRYNILLIIFFLIAYSIIESSFLVANLSKFIHGGWVSFFIGALLVTVMWTWFQARKIRNRYLEFVKLDKYVPELIELSRDTSVPKYATHLVYLTSADDPRDIEAAVVESILENHPKRADIYWLVHVDVVNEPYRMEYKVNILAPEDLIRIDFRLGFRVAPRINVMFEKVVQDLLNSKEVDVTSRYDSLGKQNKIGDFRFVVLEKFLSYENELPFYEKIIMDSYFYLKQLSLSDEKSFGLDMDNVTLEKVPLIIAPVKEVPLKRIN